MFTFFSNRFRSPALLILLAIYVLTLPQGMLLAQEATITPNYKDADIRQVIEAVGEVTGKNFVLDTRVKAQVTMFSSAPMSPDAFYEAFLSILQVYGFVAVPSGNLIKILPDANARSVPGSKSTSSNLTDDIITQVVSIKNVAAAQLVPILRPLIPQYGHLAAHPATNVLIISDRAANAARIIEYIRFIDQEGKVDFEILRLEHASAAEIVRVITSLNQSAAAGGPVTNIVADDRTNSILIRGDETELLQLRLLVANLDTPLDSGGDTRVRYLSYADAAELATKLQAQYQKSGAEQAGANTTEITIWADESTNALILTAPPKTMQSIMLVIDKLDIRRLQVLVEAVIVEVSSDKTADLGVTWALADANLENAVGVTNFPSLTGGVTALAGAIGGGDAANPAGAIGDGVTIGVGRISDSGTSIVALIQALEGNTDTNLIGTPVIVTLDNEEAEIKVGSEVPFVTGNFTGAGSAGAVVNPFQTIERQQVGLTLRITPQINEGTAIRLKIEQEISSVTESTQAVDLITSNRTISTTVIVEDGGILVLGGLIQEDLREKEQRVPILGSLPFIGALFRATSTQKIKTNLMLFIKPTILRNDQQASFETNAKYNMIRGIQLSRDLDDVPLMPGETRPILPEFDSPEPAIDLRKLNSDDQPEN